MEYGLFEDVTQPGILLPLHRALTELFFVTENRAQVRALPTSSPKAWAGRTVHHVFFHLYCSGQDSGHSPILGPRAVWAGLPREASLAHNLGPHLSLALGSPRVSTGLLILSGLKPKGEGGVPPWTSP